MANPKPLVIHAGVTAQIQSGDALQCPNGIVTYTKAGAPVDGDFTTAQDGMVVVDTTNNRIYVRIGGVWKYAALT